jgi:hypothetical protein
MFYKIINKESDVAKKLLQMRLEELQIQKRNEEAIHNKVGLYYKNFLGHNGQQNIRRVRMYDGFEFTEPEKVCLKTWKIHPFNKTVFIPNKRTKLGRDMSYFLNNELESSWFQRPLEILNIEETYRFQFPYVEAIDGVIILYLDDNHIPSDENVIEITKKEFEEIRMSDYQKML